MHGLHLVILQLKQTHALQLHKTHGWWNFHKLRSLPWIENTLELLVCSSRNVGFDSSTPALQNAQHKLDKRLIREAPNQIHSCEAARA